MGGCSGNKVFTRSYMEDYILSSPVTVFPIQNTDDIAKNPHITYQRLKSNYQISGMPSNYSRYNKKDTLENRQKFFSGYYPYFHRVKANSKEGWSEIYRTYEYKFDHSSYVDVVVEIESNKRFPLYRVIITPVKNITQQEIDNLPDEGVVYIKPRYNEPNLQLKFKYPKEKRFVNGQFISSWVFCPKCLTNVEADINTLQGLAEFDRKAERLYPLSGTPTVYRYSYGRQSNQFFDIETLYFKSDNSTASENKINKYSTKESILAQTTLLKEWDALAEKKQKAIASNAEYNSFIEKAYIPLTAESYIDNLKCGYYSAGNPNNPSKDSGYLAENRGFMRCIARGLEKYDLEGYKQFHPRLKNTEERLWASTLGVERVVIKTPENQLRVFQRKMNRAKSASKEIEGRRRIMAYENDKAEREKRIWTNAFNRAMNNIKQDQAFINNNRLVVDSNNTVMTIAEQKEQQIQRAKTQAYLDDLNKEGKGKKGSYSSSSKTQKNEHKKNLKPSANAESTINGEVEVPGNKNSESLEGRLEQEKLEKQKEKAQKEKLEKEKRERERAVSNIALTWQNKAGKWFACGPIQCIWAGSDSEKEALNYVINKGNHSIRGTSSYYRCNQYTLSSMAKNTAGDFSEERTKQRSKCLANE